MLCLLSLLAILGSYCRALSTVFARYPGLISFIYRTHVSLEIQLGTFSVSQVEKSQEFVIPTVFVSARFQIQSAQNCVLQEPGREFDMVNPSAALIASHVLMDMCQRN